MIVYKEYKIAKRHVISKVETSLVESKNSLTRHYPTRFKSIDMIANSLLLLFNKN